MPQKKVKLFQRERGAVPRLCVAKEKQKKRNGTPMRRAYVLYLITSLTAIVLCVTLLMSMVGGISGAGFQRFLSAIADGVARISFMDLSGKGKTEEPFEERESAPSSQESEGGVQKPSNSDKPSDSASESQREELTIETLYSFDYLAVPEGEIPIVPMDLSLSSYGDEYILNATGLDPDLSDLLNRPLSEDSGIEYMSLSSSPQILIVHTHGTESYSEDGALSYLEVEGEFARSKDPSESVVEVGRVLTEELNRLGLRTIHCTVLHDQEQYRDSYERAKETIEKYLERYPSIQLVIDVHRDSVLKSTGEIVRPVTLLNGEAAAQVMCVVGSDWGGEENPRWEANLALALKLRRQLNQECEGLCRPSHLKSATYNQELSPYSLLLEMGASGNSLEEALRSAYVVAKGIAELWEEL